MQVKPFRSHEQMGIAPLQLAAIFGVTQAVGLSD